MVKKKILIGVTGGIAAYKACELVSLLVKQEMDVQVIMTEKARQFVAPHTFEALSDKPVWLDEFGLDQGLSVPHVQLADQADLFVIAPATANTLAKLAYGFADNILTATALVYNKKLLVAPAMNTNMYHHPAVQKNLEILKDRDVQVIDPASGRLACGAIGQGRLAPVETILSQINYHLFEPKTMAGKQVVVTAGGTREDIDPVRYISNRSSGKMGFAMAKAAKLRGADVVLISGPVNLEPPCGVKYIQVASAREMRKSVLDHYPNADVVIKAAAVADYRAANLEQQKIKKDSNDFELRLIKNPDILKELGEQKQQQVLVGFAAETEELLQNARVKLVKKNLDLIVANDVTHKDAGFNADTNIVTLLYPDGRSQELPVMSKEILAHKILEVVESLPQFKQLNL